MVLLISHRVSMSYVLACSRKHGEQCCVFIESLIDHNTNNDGDCPLDTIPPNLGSAFLDRTTHYLPRQALCWPLT